MKLLIISLFFIVGCRESQVTPVDDSQKLNQTIKETQSSTKPIIDSVLAAIKYMGLRDSFANEARKLEILYYKTDKDKYRIGHNNLVDSIHKYTSIIHSQLNKP